MSLLQPMGSHEVVTLSCFEIVHEELEIKKKNLMEATMIAINVTMSIAVRPQLAPCSAGYFLTRNRDDTSN